jgi:hypothetical protein
MRYAQIAVPTESSRPNLVPSDDRSTKSADGRVAREATGFNGNLEEEEMNKKKVIILGLSRG